MKIGRKIDKNRLHTARKGWKKAYLCAIRDLKNVHEEVWIVAQTPEMQHILLAKLKN